MMLGSLEWSLILATSIVKTALPESVSLLWRALRSLLESLSAFGSTLLRAFVLSYLVMVALLEEFAFAFSFLLNLTFILI